MKQSPLNPKPIKLSHCEACVFLGNALREYLKNETREERIKRYERFRSKQTKITKQDVRWKIYKC
nr:MAG TPA: Saposin-like type B, region 1 [Bacteriophage sp.]